MAYLVALAVLAALVFWPSERLWPVTLFLFGPRWVFALPFILLLPLATLVDRRLAVALAALALAFVGFGGRAGGRAPRKTKAPRRGRGR